MLSDQKDAVRGDQPSAIKVNSTWRGQHAAKPTVAPLNGGPSHRPRFVGRAHSRARFARAYYARAIFAELAVGM